MHELFNLMDDTLQLLHVLPLIRSQGFNIFDFRNDSLLELGNKSAIKQLT